jgi:hypothetical protein
MTSLQQPVIDDVSPGEICERLLVPAIFAL